MRLSSFFSKYLRASDLPQPRTVTVTTVEVHTLGEGDEQKKKPVIFFQELDKGVVLGPTNSQQLEGIFNSDDSDVWIGRRVEIFNDRTVQFRGNVGGIRFRPTTEDSPF